MLPNIEGGLNSRIANAQNSRIANDPNSMKQQYEKSILYPPYDKKFTDRDFDNRAPDAGLNNSQILNDSFSNVRPAKG